jgi:hypothetical protein
MSTDNPSAAAAKARELLDMPIANAPSAPIQEVATQNPAPGYQLLLDSQNQSLTLSMALLLFGVLVIAAALWRIQRAQLTETGALRLVGATVVVVMAVFLCTAGFTLEQITPAIGLLGTMGGYVLGRSERENSPSASGGSVGTGPISPTPGANT